jgi:DNA-binding MarR family transcriptional regulator
MQQSCSIYHKLVLAVNGATLPSMTERMPRSLLLDVYAAYHKSGQLVEAALADTGITAEDFAFVSIVGGREPVTPTEISREFGLSLSTVLFRAGRNVDLGFVERVSNPQDRRSFLLRLTPSGRDAWHRGGTGLHRAVEALELRLERPAADIQEVLRELQAAFDAEVAAEGRPAERR